MIQQTWDDVFGLIGRSAPARKADESSVNYERRLATIGQRYLPQSEEVAKSTLLGYLTMPLPGFRPWRRRR